jgi:hypothetical protein
MTYESRLTDSRHGGRCVRWLFSTLVSLLVDLDCNLFVNAVKIWQFVQQQVVVINSQPNSLMFRFTGTYFIFIHHALLNFFRVRTSLFYCTSFVGPDGMYFRPLVKK